MSVKVVVLGAAGRMGKTLIRFILEEKVPVLKLHGAVDLWDAPGLGQDAGILAGGKEAGVNLTNNLEPVARDADVIIDFSSHFGTAGNAPRIAEWGTAWVVGTTGLNEEELRAIHAASEKTAVVHSGNMSLGIAVLCRLAKQAAAYFPDADIEIVEIHHRRKLDSPTGTAKRLAEAARAVRDKAMKLPFMKGTLVSEDGQALALYLPLSDKHLSYKVAEKLREKIAGLASGDTYHITGLPIAEDTFGVEMFKQMAISAPTAMLIIFLLLLLFFTTLLVLGWYFLTQQP